MLTLLALVGCGGKNTEPAKPEPAPPAEPAPTTEEAPEVEPVVVSSSAGSRAAPSAAFAPAATSFALDFHRGTPEGNAMVSGVSAFVALSMLGEGTRGETRSGFEQTLGGTLDETWHVDNQRALAAIRGTPGVQLRTANGLWVDEGEALEPAFTELIGARYGTQPTEMPFSSDPGAAAGELDSWTSEQTMGMIPSLFPPADLQDAVFVIANAVAFDGKWLGPFEPSETSPEPFQTPQGAVDVPMMHRDDKIGYYAGQGFEAVVLPYQGEMTRMMLLLPQEDRPLDQLEGELTAQTFYDVAKKSRPRSVKLALPKLKLEQTHELRELLPHLDLAGDFSGIAPRIVIGAAIQKTFLEVDEAGTKAAAVTGVVGTRSAPPPPVEVRFDRPFLFAIWHDETGVPLFTGRIVDPRG